MRDLALLTAGLPFGLDDPEAANRAFAAGRAGDRAARRHADIWAYAWALRYTTRKFARERTGAASDVDTVLTRAVEGVQRAWERLEDADRFAAYVSKVCKNSLLTHRARHKTTVEADDTTLGPTLDDERFATDGVIVRKDLAAAIAAMPPAVRVVAEMRILDGRSFEDVAEATGHPLPTVRTYSSKAHALLRTHPVLRAHHYDDVLPPGAIPDRSRAVSFDRGS